MIPQKGYIDGDGPEDYIERQRTALIRAGVPPGLIHVNQAGDVGRENYLMLLGDGDVIVVASLGCLCRDPETLRKIVSEMMEYGVSVWAIE